MSLVIEFYKCKKEDFLLRQMDPREFDNMCARAYCSFFGFDEFIVPAEMQLQMEGFESPEYTYITSWTATKRNFYWFAFRWLRSQIKNEDYRPSGTMLNKREIRKFIDICKRINRKVITNLSFSDKEIAEIKFLEIVNKRLENFTVSKQYLSDIQQACSFFVLLEAIDFDRDVVFFRVKLI